MLERVECHSADLSSRLSGAQATEGLPESTEYRIFAAVIEKSRCRPSFADDLCQLLSKCQLARAEPRCFSLAIFGAFEMEESRLSTSYIYCSPNPSPACDVALTYQADAEAGSLSCRQGTRMLGQVEEKRRILGL